MDDLISRQAAIDFIKNYQCKDCSDIGLCGNCAVLVALKLLGEVPPAQRWIPCSERLPMDGERVLCTHLGGLNPNRQVIEHIYQDGKFTLGWDMDMDVHSPSFGQRYMGEVIAWMPLPEPYKEEENMNCTDCKRRYVGNGWICWSGNKKSIGACNNGLPTKNRIVYRKGETRKEKT